MTPATLGGGGGVAHVHNHNVSPGLICIIHCVTNATLDVGGGGAHLHHPLCDYLGWRWGGGSFA